jgi:LuxR family maltose regulon positive regulatory protein
MRTVVQPSVLLDQKLTPPPDRDGSLQRTALVDRVRREEHPVVTVVAPAGYGKTTFLRQWASAESRAVAWVSLDAADDDDTVLLSYLATALDRIEPIDRGVFDSLAAPRGPLYSPALSRLGAAIWNMSSPSVLMLDDVDSLGAPAARDVIGWLAEHLSPRMRLAVASRSVPSIPIGRLRMRGQLLEIGSRELALDRDEATAVLSNEGVRLTVEQVTQLLDRIEGWPAGVYVAALSMRAGGADVAGDGFLSGANRFVADYLRSELLERLSPDDLRFLERTSVLNRMSGPLCDALLESSSSSETLERLERSNLFLTPLDPNREWFRYHHLFRDLLVAELRRHEPSAELALLARASSWHEARGEWEPAVEYAHAAGHLERAATIIAAHALELYRAGRIATLERWFGWFDDQLVLERQMPLATIGAWLWALVGNAVRAERWADAADRGGVGSTDPRARPWLAMLRSAMARGTAQEMLADARLAVEEMAANDPWRATSFLVGAVGELTAGSAAASDHLLARGAEIGAATGAAPATAATLALRSLLAAQRGDWRRAAEHVHRALGTIRDHHLEGYMPSALAWAASARVNLHTGSVEEARADLAQVHRLRPLLSVAIPWFAVQVRLEAARVYLGLGEPSGARTMLDEATEILEVRPALSVQAEDAQRLRAQVRSVGGGRPGVETLTTAELRVLAYLPTHLSFREIAERLYVSPNTVKTQAVSIYGKLDASSRSGAIERAVETGLLDPSTLRVPNPLMRSG